jgi:spermidine synthase
MNTRHASSIVIITGFAITAIEIAAARIAAPYVGNSLFVWGSSIGVVLFALAVGYAYGGRWADKNPSSRRLGWSILVAALWLVPIPLLFGPVSIGLIRLLGGIPFGLILITQLLMFLFFFVPLTALGVVSPYVIRLTTMKLETAGQIIGRLFAISTAGSLLGIWLSAFVLIPLAGVRATLLIVATGLIVLAGVLVRPRVFFALILVALSAFSLSQPLKRGQGVVFARESPYQYVQVVDANNQRLLITDDGLGAQSVLREGQQWSGSYYDLLTAAPAFRPDSSRTSNVLILGLGAGTLTHQLRNIYGPSMDITGVEIDPAIIEAGRKYFNLESSGAHIVNDEARSWLTRQDRMWNVIVIDVFNRQLSVPAEFTTKEFFQNLSERLTPDGVVAMNVITFPHDTVTASLSRSLRATFPFVITAGETGEHAGNTIFFASRQALNAAAAATILNQHDAPSQVSDVLAQAQPVIVNDSAPLLTDDRNSIELHLAARSFLFRVRPSYIPQ